MKTANIFKLGTYPYLVSEYFQDVRTKLSPNQVEDKLLIESPEEYRTNIEFNIVATPREHQRRYKCNKEKIVDLYNLLRYRQLKVALPDMMAKIRYQVKNDNTGEVLKEGFRTIVFKDENSLYEPVPDVYISQYSGLEFLTINQELHGSRCNNRMLLVIKDITFYNMIVDDFNKNDLATNMHHNCIGRDLFIDPDGYDWNDKLFQFSPDNKRILLNKNGILNTPQIISTDRIFVRKYHLSTGIQHNHKIRFKINLHINDLILLNNTESLKSLIREG